MFMIRNVTERLLDVIRRLLGGPPAKIQAAALPWREKDGKLEVLLVTSRQSKRWIVPKGWPKSDETLSETAVREVWEEAGIRGEAPVLPIGRYFYTKSAKKGIIRRFEVHLFALKTSTIADKWPERRVRDRRWFSPPDAAKLVSEPALSELISKFAVSFRKSVA